MKNLGQSGSEGSEDEQMEGYGMTRPGGPRIQDSRIKSPGRNKKNMARRDDRRNRKFDDRRNNRKEGEHHLLYN